MNYYRNMDRNWQTTPQLAGAHHPKVPVAPHRRGRATSSSAAHNRQRLRTQMSRVADDLRVVKVVPAAGHWIQQEKATETNAAILSFLASLTKSKT